MHVYAYGHTRSKHTGHRVGPGMRFGDCVMIQFATEEAASVHWYPVLFTVEGTSGEE